MGNIQLLSSIHQVKENWNEDSRKTWNKYNKIENIFFHLLDKNFFMFLAISKVFSKGGSFFHIPSLFGWGGDWEQKSRVHIHLLWHKALDQVFFA